MNGSLNEGLRMKQPRNSGNRPGFTLAELLVTVTIIAVLAAVVVPSIGGTLFKGDVGRSTSDLTNMRGGMEQFLADVRKYPGRPIHLTTKIIANSSTSDFDRADSLAYSTNAVTRWKGPYMNTQIVSTGFGGTILDRFLRVDCANGASSSTPWTTTVPGTASPCAAMVVLLVTPADAKRVDLAMDDSVSNTGVIRWKTTGTDSLIFLALPIQ